MGRALPRALPVGTRGFDAGVEFGAAAGYAHRTGAIKFLAGRGYFTELDLLEAVNRLGYLSVDCASVRAAS